MPKVDLVFDADCPNVPAAREQLRLAFEAIGIPPRWRELNNDADAVPDYARGFGSPTILVDGVDVTGAEKVQASCCRVYPTRDGALAGVPSVDAIIEALRRGGPSGGSERGPG